MAYIYQVSFDILPEQMSQLQIGAALRRVLGYLRTILPAEPGYVTSRAMDSIDMADRTQLIFQSVWQTWEDLDTHRRSSRDEAKVLIEFQSHIAMENLSIHLYEEVA
jgi:hypothetical protein